MDKELALKIYRAYLRLEILPASLTFHDFTRMVQIPTIYSSNESMYALRIDDDHAIVAIVTSYTDDDGELVPRARVKCLNLKEFFKRGY